MRITEVWAKFVETSQYMENLLDDFNLEYPWTESNAMNVGQLQKPDRDATKNQPMAGMRDLYCFWIDYILGKIESKAADWLPAAKANYEAEFGSGSDGKK